MYRFSPQLIAGPIVRYAHIYEQIETRSIDLNGVFNGMLRFMAGFIKKVLLANTVAKAADAVFGLASPELTAGIAWVGIIAYTLQIYLDFSAYSDMAIGLAKIFGFDLHETLICLILPPPFRISGVAGISRCPPGSAITCTSH